MDTKENIYGEFQKVMEKEKGVKLSLKEATEGLDTLAKFFGALWKFDQEDKRKVKQIENKNYAI